MEYSPRYRRFRALLRQIRQEAGLSQVALSAKLQKTQVFVSRSERGERGIDFLETVDYCAACKVPVAQFLARLEPAGTQEETAPPKRLSPRRMDNQGRLVR